jgi:hypothetical protein
MITDINSRQHTPTNEFRDFLESEVVREYRRNRTFRRLRAAAVIVVSVGIGMTTTLASAQVRENAQRDSLLEAAKADALMAALRHNLAKFQLVEAQTQVSVGARSSSAVSEAEVQLTESEYEVARAALNIREIEATGMPIRDDLNAPLVRGEDFVKARLDGQAMLADRRLRAAERRRDEVARRVSVGAAAQTQLGEADLAVVRARGELLSLAERIKARAAFLQKRTPIEELTRQIERTEVQQQIVIAQQALRNSQATLALLERQRAVGANNEIDVLRGRLDVAERELELRRLSERLQRLRD